MAKYLAHHGIKGQRWGVRRFQSTDGSLTPLGKRRYGNPNEHGNTILNKEGKKQLEKDYRSADMQAAKAVLDGTANSLNTAANAVGNIGKNKSKSINKSDYSKLTDAQLREKINRLSMEKTYGELTGDTKRVRSGADWSREVLQTVGSVVAIGASAAGIALTINNIRLGKKEKNGG